MNIVSSKFELQTRIKNNCGITFNLFSNSIPSKTSEESCIKFNTRYEFLSTILIENVYFKFSGCGFFNLTSWRGVATL